jgi:hypothetical protein
MHGWDLAGDLEFGRRTAQHNKRTLWRSRHLQCKLLTSGDLRNTFQAQATFCEGLDGRRRGLSPSVASVAEWQAMSIDLAAILSVPN